MEIKIEHGIPIPKPDRSNRRGAYQKRKWDTLFNEMQEGDSVVLSIKEASSFRCNINLGVRNPSHKLVQRYVNKGEGTVRLWKVLK